MVNKSESCTCVWCEKILSRPTIPSTGLQESTSPSESIQATVGWTSIYSTD